MSKSKIKYLVASLAIIGTSACSERVIILPQGTAIQTTRNTHVINQAPVPIQEEILIGQNQNLGTRIDTFPNSSSIDNSVDVPQNNPSIGNQGTISDIPLQNTGHMERIDFPVDEYKSIKKTGRSTVSGKVYVENSNNSKKFIGKKVKLYLNPVTSYSEQWYQESYLGGYKMSKSDPRLYNYLKFTMSDEMGKFDFFGIASGRYYLVGTITCGAECGFSQKETIRLVKEVSVGRGTTKVDLTKRVP